MKVGDLVRLKINNTSTASYKKSTTGVIVRMISFERGRNPQPVVLINGKCQLFGAQVCEVISESK